MLQDFNKRNETKEIKVKVKVHTLDIAPLCSESPLQKRSGMSFMVWLPPAGSGVVRIDPLRFLAGCCKR